MLGYLSIMVARVSLERLQRQRLQELPLPFLNPIAIASMTIVQPWVALLERLSPLLTNSEPSMS